jgi:hypothetical protein
VTATLTVKPVVKYRTDRPHMIQLGYSALCYPMAHPSSLVTGDGDTPVRTSQVLCVDDNGEFWTENTHYVPGFPGEEEPCSL